MRPEAQRIAIARACGWMGVEWYEDNAGPPLLVGTPPSSHPKKYGRDDRKVPNYPADLNACAEMEKVLKGIDRIGYVNLLAESLETKPEASAYEYAQRCAFATAPQRCEAFLKTLGLWEEPK